MGVNSCCGARPEPIVIDLPWNPIVVSNDFQRFEVSLPFKYTQIDVFEERTRAIAVDGGVTIEQLRSVLTTIEWTSLKVDSSRICKMLKHEVF